MARVFVTGSSDGLGQMAAQLLLELGHQVVLHARNEQRAKDALAAVPCAAAVVIGDLASIAQTKRVADQVNRIGVFDAVIHNAAVGNREPKRLVTEDGLPHVFAINTLAPYLLSAEEICFHGLNRPSVATSASHSARISPSIRQDLRRCGQPLHALQPGIACAGAE
jgi:NAD(P)-dependent dehydrogenase (short-subunit alcohol dehydrogenase family)